MTSEVGPDVRLLRDPATIRSRCHNILEAGLRDELEHFSVDLDALEDVADRVVEVTQSTYPQLDIPYHSRWNHFRAGGVDRVLDFDRLIRPLPKDEQGRARFDLIVTSVLLDAGAGPRWGFEEDGTRYTRSEGLAVASYHLFVGGALSSTASFTADRTSLESFSPEKLAAGFQVSEDNPLVGMEGRVALMQGLGRALGSFPASSGTGANRPGALFDDLASHHAATKRIPAKAVFDLVLERFANIWPNRIVMQSANLGDVWRHPKAGGEGATEGLVPFHKLSQWLTYSLLEPLERAGFEVFDLDALTGLAEYRNGGLFVDGGVLVPKHEGILGDAHEPGSEVVVEWRACTVALLDRVAQLVRKGLGVDERAFPLAKVLEGGTWQAGREIAREKRADATPPIRIQSDGTLF